MRFKKWLWMALVLCPAPLFFNCHRPTGLAFSSHESGIARAPASGNAATEEAFAPHGKIVLDSASIISTKMHSSGAGSSTGLLKDGASIEKRAVRRGLRLAATIDNECLAARIEKAKSRAQMSAPESGSATGANADSPALSEEAAAASQQKKINGLREQLYAFVTTTDTDLEELTARANADECVLRVQNDERVQLAMPPPHDSPRTADTERTAKIESTSNDPGLSMQKHLAAINAPSGWDVFYSAGAGITQDVTVAIVDTGVDYNHEDLSANMWQSAGGARGMDFENSDSDPMDDNGHGTHVAGLIGAVHNNSIGVSGVAGVHMKLMPVKVTDSSGSAFPSVIANGVRWAADNGAEVINLSLGLSGTSTALRDALVYALSAGAVVVMAAGNETLELTLAESNFVSPASYSIKYPGSLAIAAVDSETGALSSFSNYSSTYVQLAAPGSNGIVSTFRGNQYVSMSGTSMATPIVSGTAALVVGYLKTKQVAYTPADVTNLILASARTNSALYGKVINGATLDLDRLGKYLLRRYGIESDGGTESP